MASDPDILTVSALNAHIKSLFEQTFPLVCVTGELSNFKPHTSGHWYFSLKDERSQLRCAMFRRQNQSVGFLPDDGMQVVIHGQLSVYEAKGEYQLIAGRMIPSGEGALRAAYERLKARLLAEGLFDPAKRRPLPPYPERIGVITSPTGAAIRDIIHVLERRAPWIQVILRPTAVQGAGAAREIARAIEEMNAYGEVDALIVGRGGGSIEDLWAFNEEPVVRAIAASVLPIVSAVGHETDVTLSDFAADARAPTPSGAAEMVTRDRKELLDRVSGSISWLHKTLVNRMRQNRQKVDALTASYGMRRPIDLISQRTQQTDELTRRLVDLWPRTLEAHKQTVANLVGRLQALSPLSVLERGYAVCRSAQDGRLIRDVAELRVGAQVEVAFHRGNATCRVERVSAGSGEPTPPRARPSALVNRENLDLFDEQ